MTALPQSTRRKLSLLNLAEELGNVSKACRIMGYHRDSFYEIKRAFQVGGVHALVEQKRGPRGPHPNRVSPEIEAAILDYALERPTWGQQRVANELRLKGHQVSPGGVRGVWLRHELETRHKRLLRLETGFSLRSGAPRNARDVSRNRRPRGNPASIPRARAVGDAASSVLDAM